MLKVLRLLKSLIIFYTIFISLNHIGINSNFSFDIGLLKASAQPTPVPIRSGPLINNNSNNIPNSLQGSIIANPSSPSIQNSNIFTTDMYKAFGVTDLKDFFAKSNQQGLLELNKNYSEGKLIRQILNPQIRPVLHTNQIDNLFQINSSTKTNSLTGLYNSLITELYNLEVELRSIKTTTDADRVRNLAETSKRNMSNTLSHPEMLKNEIRNISTQLHGEYSQRPTIIEKINFRLNTTSTILNSFNPVQLQRYFDITAFLLGLLNLEPVKHPRRAGYRSAVQQPKQNIATAIQNGIRNTQAVKNKPLILRAGAPADARFVEVNLPRMESELSGAELMKGLVAGSVQLSFVSTVFLASGWIFAKVQAEAAYNDALKALPGNPNALEEFVRNNINPLYFLSFAAFGGAAAATNQIMLREIVTDNTKKLKYYIDNKEFLLANSKDYPKLFKTATKTLMASLNFISFGTGFTAAVATNIIATKMSACFKILNDLPSSTGGTPEQQQNEKLCNESFADFASERLPTLARHFAYAYTAQQLLLLTGQAVKQTWFHATKFKFHAFGSNLLMNQNSPTTGVKAYFFRLLNMFNTAKNRIKFNPAKNIQINGKFFTYLPRAGKFAWTMTWQSVVFYVLYEVVSKHTEAAIEPLKIDYEIGNSTNAIEEGFKDYFENYEINKYETTSSVRTFAERFSMAFVPQMGLSTYEGLDKNGNRIEGEGHSSATYGNLIESLDKYYEIKVKEREHLEVDTIVEKQRAWNLNMANATNMFMATQQLYDDITSQINLFRAKDPTVIGRNYIDSITNNTTNPLPLFRSNLNNVFPTVPENPLFPNFNPENPLYEINQASSASIANNQAAITTEEDEIASNYEDPISAVSTTLAEQIKNAGSYSFLLSQTNYSPYLFNSQYSNSPQSFVFGEQDQYFYAKNILRKKYQHLYKASEIALNWLTLTNNGRLRNQATYSEVQLSIHDSLKRIFTNFSESLKNKLDDPNKLPKLEPSFFTNFNELVEIFKKYTDETVEVINGKTALDICIENVYTRPASEGSVFAPMCLVFPISLLIQGPYIEIYDRLQSGRIRQAYIPKYLGYLDNLITQFNYEHPFYWIYQVFFGNFDTEIPIQEEGKEVPPPTFEGPAIKNLILVERYVKDQQKYHCNSTTVLNSECIFNNSLALLQFESSFNYRVRPDFGPYKLQPKEKTNHLFRLDDLPQYQGPMAMPMGSKYLMEYYLIFQKMNIDIEFYPETVLKSNLVSQSLSHYILANAICGPIAKVAQNGELIINDLLEDETGFTVKMRPPSIVDPSVAQEACTYIYENPWDMYSKIVIDGDRTYFGIVDFLLHNLHPSLYTTDGSNTNFLNFWKDYIKGPYDEKLAKMNKGLKSVNNDLKLTIFSRQRPINVLKSTNVTNIVDSLTNELTFILNKLKDIYNDQNNMFYGPIKVRNEFSGQLERQMARLSPQELSDSSYFSKYGLTRETYFDSLRTSIEDHLVKYIKLSQEASHQMTISDDQNAVIIASTATTALNELRAIREPLKRIIYLFQAMTDKEYNTYIADVLGKSEAEILETVIPMISDSDKPSWATLPSHCQANFQKMSEIADYTSANPINELSLDTIFTDTTISDECKNIASDSLWLNQKLVHRMIDIIYTDLVEAITNVDAELYQRDYAEVNIDGVMQQPLDLSFRDATFNMIRDIVGAEPQN